MKKWPWQLRKIVAWGRRNRNAIRPNNAVLPNKYSHASMHVPICSKLSLGISPST